MSAVQNGSERPERVYPPTDTQSGMDLVSVAMGGRETVAESTAEPSIFGHGEAFRDQVLVMNNQEPIAFWPMGGGVMVVQGGRDEALCTLRHVDGRWTVEYEPENLDEAARVFLDAVRMLAESHG